MHQQLAISKWAPRGTRLLSGRSGGKGGEGVCARLNACVSGVGPAAGPTCTNGISSFFWSSSVAMVPPLCWLPSWLPKRSDHKCFGNTISHGRLAIGVAERRVSSLHLPTRRAKKKRRCQLSSAIAVPLPNAPRRQSLQLCRDQ